MMNINTNFSSYNQEVLHNYSKKLWEDLGSPLEQAAAKKVQTQSLFSRSMFYLYSWLPRSKTVGETSGKALVRAHGADLNREVISFTYEKMVGNHIGSTAIIEGIHLAATPYLLPLMETLGIAAGGLTVPAGLWLCSFLYNRAFSSPDRPVTIFNAPEINALLTQGEDRVIRDALGNALGSEDLKFIRKTIAKMNIAAELIAADKESLDQVIGKYLRLRGDDADFYYVDGTKASDEEIEIIEKAYDTLRDNANIAKKSKNIRKMINKLAKHTLVSDQRERLKGDFILCEDGKIINPLGLVVSREEYEAAIMVGERGQKFLEDFVVIDLPDSSQ